MKEQIQIPGHIAQSIASPPPATRDKAPKSIRRSEMADGMEKAIDLAVNDAITNRVGRKIYIYGTGSRGRFALHALSRKGIQCSAFLDSWAKGQSSILGIPVQSPYELMHEEPAKVFILVAIQNPEAPMETLQNLGMKEGEHFLRLFDRSIDDGAAITPSYNVLDFTLGYASATRPKGYSTLHSTDALREGPRAEADSATNALENARPASHPLKVLVLGGSTTDPDVIDPGILKPAACAGVGTQPMAHGSWPRQLAALCKEAGIPLTIINGGMGGYTSSQELLKLVRDGLQQAPDLVISLTGMNDACGKYWVHDRYARSHSFLATLEDVLLKKLPEQPSTGIQQITYGLECPRSRAEAWHDNQRMMAALCREFGIRYFAFLQPFGLHDPEYIKQPEVEYRVGWFLHNFFTCTPPETLAFEKPEDLPRQDLLQQFVDKVFSAETDQEKHFGISYPAIEAFYKEIQQERYRKDYIIPIVDALYAYSDIFHDTAHCTPEGNRALAERIFRELQARDAFTPYSAVCNKEGLR